jgi:hypothetical protein
MDSLFLFFAVLIFRSLIVDPQTPSFRIRIFSELRNVVSLFQLLGCVFDSSLMPILCSGRPPSIQDIKSVARLRQGDRFWRDKWGVYIAILENSGCRPILYVGSSVAVQDGLYGRFADYTYVVFRGSQSDLPLLTIILRTRYTNNRPVHVRRAIQNGYKITYFVVPFYFIQPSNPVLLGFAQTLVLAVEHVLTFRLWTMVGGWKNCERLALWKKSDQEYDGANGHSCMFESRSLEEARPDEIAQLLQERSERKKKQQAIYRATHREEIRACQKEWEDEHKEERKTQKRAWNEANREHVNEYGRGRAKKAKDTEEFPCEDCQKLFANKRELERHQSSGVACKPKRDAARTDRLTCGGCQEVFSQMGNLQRHEASGSCLGTRALEEMSCSTCGKVIKNKANMQRHQATHKQ